MQVRRIVRALERRSRIERLGCRRGLDDECGKDHRGRDCQWSCVREGARRGSGHDVAHLLTAVVWCAHARACVVRFRAGTPSRRPRRRDRRTRLRPRKRRPTAPGRRSTCAHEPARNESAPFARRVQGAVLFRRARTIGHRTCDGKALKEARRPISACRYSAVAAPGTRSRAWSLWSASTIIIAMKPAADSDSKPPV
jgi:hypothetical protein